MEYSRTALNAPRQCQSSRSLTMKTPQADRPLSVVLVLGKDRYCLIETIMDAQLLSYFERTYLLSHSQHGFRPSKLAAAESFSKILDAFENKESMYLSLGDLSNAFDCISHTILLGKLERYGIGGSILHSLELYLVSIQQLVSVMGWVQPRGN